MTKRIPLAVAFAAFAVACSDPATSPTRTLVAGSVDAAVGHPIDFDAGGTYPPNLDDGIVRLCKTANAAGSFSFTWSLNDAAPVAIPGGPIVLAAAGTECRNIYTSTVVNATGVDKVVITEAADAADWSLTGRTVDQYYGAHVTYDAPRLSDDDATPARGVTIYINDDMARLVTFTNTYTAPPPPPPACDFITFGRLVWEEGSQKVVISGNAGGNAPGGGILGEFHIEVNGVDHHVATVSTYGPIAAPALASGTYTNSRQATGTDKHGHAVDLRLWDGGEPGKDTDRFWFSIAGASVGNATSGNLIDQGNMQYHPQCRGPKS